MFVVMCSISEKYYSNYCQYHLFLKCGNAHSSNPQATFLGHEIDADGIHISADKIMAV